MAPVATSAHHALSASQRTASMLAEVLSSNKFCLQKSMQELETLLQKPKDLKKGDFTLPCFQFAKPLSLKPPDVAKLLGECLDVDRLKSAGIAQVEVAGPYLNFFVSRGLLAAATIPAIMDGSFLKPQPPKADKVMVEYSQPNTHKAFHVGHLRNVALGDSLGRLLKWYGHEVVMANYIGDEGAHVAKCLWHLRKYFHGELPSEHLGEFLGEHYAKGNEMLSLDSLTKVPLPGVRAALVKDIQIHPHDGTWLVTQVEIADKVQTVVTGASGFKVGDLVAYAAPGTRLGKKVVGILDKKGVESSGMLLSELELGVSKEKDSIAVVAGGQKLALSYAQSKLNLGYGKVLKPTLSSHAHANEELAEIYRFPGALLEDAKVLDQWQQLKAECSEVLQAIESGKGEIWEQWKETKEWSMDEFRQIYSWIGAHFDDWFFESDYGETSKQLVREHQKSGVFIESNGAVGADLQKFGLGFCPLIKSDGTALYATRDLSLAQHKFEKYGIDKSIYVVGDEQTFHFQQVFKCLELMGYAQASKCHHLAYGMVEAPDGKMSSRKGTVILFSQLEKQLLAKIRSEFLNKFSDVWPEEEIAEAAYKIALATMRYGMLNQDSRSKIVFDMDQWCSLSGNTGPYLLYAYARTRSILRTVGDVDCTLIDWDLLTHELEGELIAQLSGYTKAMEQAAEQLAPQVVCIYVYELAKKFNQWFNHKDCSVVKAQSKALQATRAVLVDATGRVIQQALSLIGVATIERM